jgi:RHS repeat-associated protein
MKRLIVVLAILLFSSGTAHATSMYENLAAQASLLLGDPVNASNGALRFDLPLLNSAFNSGGPMDLHFSVLYGSDFGNWRGNAFFAGQAQTYWWSPWCAAYLGAQMYQFWLEDFRKVAFDPTTGEIEEGNQKSPVRYKMEARDDHVYLMDPVRERVYIFEKSSDNILYILDRKGNRLRYSYTGNILTKLDDTLGRELNFTYTTFDGDRVLTQVTDQGGRDVFINYEQNAPDNDGRLTLRSVTDASGQQTVLGYRPWDCVVSLKKPEENTPYTQTWQDNVSLAGTPATRVVSQTTAYGDTTNAAYDATQNKVTETRPDTTEVTYTHYGVNQPPKSLTDAAGKTMAFSESAHAQPTGVTDRMGDTTTISYHTETGKILTITNNKGNTITNTYTAQEQTITNPDNNETVGFTFYNLTRIDYPDGTKEQFTYDGRGNMLTRVDRNNNTWTYTYNDRGQVLTVTNPTGGVTTYTYNADATLASATDSDTGTTTYEYDGYKRPIKTVHPDTTSVAVTYDLNDQVTSITDERGNAYAYTYDKNGNLVTATDPANKAIRTAYDLMDRAADVTDRRGMKTEYAYNSMNQLESVTDPNNNETQYGYDARGRMNKVTDGTGKVWRTGYDDEGLSVSETTPLGFATTITRDKLGYVTGVSDPLSRTTTLTRDSMTRITGVTDPMNRRTTYGYDGNGLLTSVTLPVVGTARYTRNALGLLSNIEDLNGNNWVFTQTDMGRPASMSDPLGHKWQYAHDQRGRLVQTTYPDATTQGLTLDGAGNVTARTYSQGLTLNYTYDDLDRMLTAENINFAYNETGRVTATTNPGTIFGATYDDGGRVKTATYANALFTVTYTYDERNLLTRVTDSLTNTTVQFTHDEDARLTGITRSSGANTAFALDNASRITRIQHGTLGDLQYTYNAAGEVTKLDYDLPLDPADHITANTDTFTYDTASRVSSAGYTHDARGRMTATPTDTFTWDGASRLTATSDATLAYNGLNDLLTRKVNGTTLHCYYNYALDLKPMVAEKNDGTDQWQRFYVLTPGGRLLYMIDASDGNKVYFYHYDKTGNTLFLTDAAGAVTDSYAHTPYGKLLAHEGSNEQPFTFVGAWQIRREGDSGLYQMRARYYDAVTARFMSREPVWPRISDPRTLSPYAYATQNPLTFIDPLGLERQVSSWRYGWTMLLGLIPTVIEDSESAPHWAEVWNKSGLEERLEMLRAMDTCPEFRHLRVNYGKNLAEQFLRGIIKFQKRGRLEKRKLSRLETSDSVDTIQPSFAATLGTPISHESTVGGSQGAAKNNLGGPVDEGKNWFDIGQVYAGEDKGSLIGFGEGPIFGEIAEPPVKRLLGEGDAAEKLKHLIQWSQTETSDDYDGIGSRFFTVK